MPTTLNPDPSTPHPMAQTAFPSCVQTGGARRTIFWAGLVAGNLDAIAGVVAYYFYFGLNPIQVLQFIASGVYGPGAIGGGASMIVAGIAFHFLIALAGASIYFLAYPRIRWLAKYEQSAGLLYGLGIWFVMNLLVLPQSNIPKSPFDGGLAAVGIAWHMVLVGLPIAIITGRHYRGTK